MSGDPNQTSTKLRNAAIELIKERKRPMASHEIEKWVRENDKSLCHLISSKCADYVRIILSVTQDNYLIKYKTLIPIPGVDKRSTFYGLVDGSYDSNEWVPIVPKSPKQKKVSSKKISSPEYKPIKNKVTLTIPEVPPPQIPQPAEDPFVFNDLMEEFKFETMSSGLFIDNMFDDTDFAFF